MFERFTGRARQVVVLAQDEARGLRHNYIGTEHLLLGLLREEEGIAARVLDSLEITVEDVRAKVVRIVGEGEDEDFATGQIPFTPRAKKILELSLREALKLRHGYIGTEHILLGLVEEGEGVANRIMLDLGADGETLRNAVLGRLAGLQRRSLVEDVRAEEEAVELVTPPLAPEVVAELERLTSEQQALIESQDFDAAARLRARESPLRSAAARLVRAWRQHSGDTA